MKLISVVTVENQVPLKRTTNACIYRSQNWPFWAAPIFIPTKIDEAHECCYFLNSFITCDFLKMLSCMHYMFIVHMCDCHM